MSGRVIVVGSVNVDLVATADRLPAPGETVTGATFADHDGGKGTSCRGRPAGARTAFSARPAATLRLRAGGLEREGIDRGARASRVRPASP
jgi:hypothetical protein